MISYTRAVHSSSMTIHDHIRDPPRLSAKLVCGASLHFLHVNPNRKANIERPQTLQSTITQEFKKYIQSLLREIVAREVECPKHLKPLR